MIQKLAKQTKSLAAISTIAVTLLQGCASSLPETKVYSLSTWLPSSLNEQAPLDLRIGIGPVLFPDKLKRPQIVTRISNNELRLSEEHHWGGYLEREFLTTLVQNISLNLKNASVNAYPWDNRRKPKYQVQLQVFQFDGHLTKESNLSVAWNIVDASGKKEFAQQNSSYVETLNGDGYTEMVAALSKALGLLSADIAQEIRHIENSQAQKRLD